MLGIANIQSSLIVTFVSKLIVALWVFLYMLHEKAPLRRIIGRDLVIHTVHPNGKPNSFSVMAMLECGHQVDEHGWMFFDLVNAYTACEDTRKKRHRCRDCQVIARAKKPLASVPCFDKAVSA